MKYNYYFLYLLTGLMTLLQGSMVFSRNAPVTTAGSSSVCPGVSVSVPVTVNGFTNIKAITLRLDYDPTQLTFLSYANLNSSIASASVNNVSVSPTLTKIMIVWADITALSLANGSKLVDLNFTLLSGSPVLMFNNTDNGGGDCEFADENGASMNDVPTETYYMNATINSLAVVTAGSITGPGIVCSGTSNVLYSVPPVTNATGYIWTVPPGGSIISGGNTNTITVNYSLSASSGNVTVKGTNNCGEGTPSSLPVTLKPSPTPSLNGNLVVCASQGNEPYNTEAGMSDYTWSVSPGGTIMFGAGTNSVLVNWNTPGNQSISVNYILPASGCFAPVATTKTITVLATATPTLSGPSQVCIGSTGIVYTTEPGMNSYQWNISPGGLITSGGGTSDNSVTITWNSSGSQSVSVNYINSSGCFGQYPAVKDIYVSPLPIPVISGPGEVCESATGILYTTEPGMINYQWSISAGGIITAGAGTNTIAVSWNTPGSQFIAVNYTNPIGCTGIAPTVKSVAVTSFPGIAGVVNGADTICAGTIGVIYSIAPVTNATHYDWTIPGSATITAGFGTNSITVSFNTTPGSGIINVKGTNACGNGTPSPDFFVTMVGSQALPVVTANGALLTSSIAEGNQWYYEGTGLIPGATAPTYTATITGWYWTVVKGVGCPSLESNHVYVLFTGTEYDENETFKIFPNPNNGFCSISFNSPAAQTIHLQVVNMLGVEVFHYDIIAAIGNYIQNIDLSHVKPGIYTFILRGNQTSGIRKVVVR